MTALLLTQTPVLTRKLASMEMKARRRVVTSLRPGTKGKRTPRQTSSSLQTDSVYGLSPTIMDRMALSDSLFTLRAFIVATN